MVVNPAMSWWSARPAAGPAEGRAGEYRWEAYLARGPVSYGLNPATLYKGYGRIIRLVLYAPVAGTGLWQKVAAFHRCWLYGRREHLAIIRQIVGELERRAG